MKQLTFLLFGLCLTTSSIVFGQTEKIAPNQFATFKIKNAGLTVDGKIGGLSGTVLFDEKNLAKAFFNVSLDATSINTENKTRDGHLQKEVYFDGTNYPKITFKTIKIESTTSGFVAIGNLTIKGITKTIKLPFTYTKTNSGSLFKGTFEINRLDYNIGSSSWIMSDDVVIALAISTTN